MRKTTRQSSIEGLTRTNVVKAWRTDVVKIRESLGKWESQDNNEGAGGQCNFVKASLALGAELFDWFESEGFDANEADRIEFLQTVTMLSTKQSLLKLLSRCMEPQTTGTCPPKGL